MQSSESNEPTGAKPKPHYKLIITKLVSKWTSGSSLQTRTTQKDGEAQAILQQSMCLKVTSLFDIRVEPWIGECKRFVLISPFSTLPFTGFSTPTCTNGK